MKHVELLIWHFYIGYIHSVCTAIVHLVILHQWIDTMVIVDDSCIATNVGSQSWNFEWYIYSYEGYISIHPHLLQRMTPCTDSFPYVLQHFLCKDFVQLWDLNDLPLNLPHLIHQWAHLVKQLLILLLKLTKEEDSWSIYCRDLFLAHYCSWSTSEFSIIGAPQGKTDGLF